MAAWPARPKPHVHTRAREALAAGRGVCQDFAHVMISLCRAASIPARYVGGVRILHVERRGVQG